MAIAVIFVGIISLAMSQLNNVNNGVVVVVVLVAAAAGHKHVGDGDDLQVLHGVATLLVPVIRLCLHQQLNRCQV